MIYRTERNSKGRVNCKLILLTISQFQHRYYTLNHLYSFRNETTLNQILQTFDHLELI